MSRPLNTNLTLLGIESSCDDTAAAVVRRFEDGRVQVLSSKIRGQTDEHSPFGGVVPEIAARAHLEYLDQLITVALEESGLKLSELDGIAATAGPGLIGGVMSGLMTAKALAVATGKPLLAVNHLEGHALSVKLSHDVAFPYLLLLVSGGHTQLLWVSGVGEYERLGSTRDDAAGEAFDKAAKIMGLGFPGGPAIERYAKDGDPNRFDLPVPMTGQKHCDFSYAGLKTAVMRAWESLDDPTEQDKSDLAASFQSAATKALVNRTSRAMEILREREDIDGNIPLIVAGGVAANTYIYESLCEAASGFGFDVLRPPMTYCTDNAAMIALAGAERLALGETSELTVSARPRWPLDEEAAMAAPKSGSGRKGPRS